MPWLPDDFVHPIGVELPTGHHLRPMREDDVAIDYPAVMGSQARLLTIFGPAWGWPEPSLTYEADQRDLARHEREIAAHESFLYGVFDADESQLFGCIYVDPPERVSADGDIFWWVIDAEVDGLLDTCLRDFVPSWISSAWPFTAPRFIGRDLTWSDWLALPSSDGSR